MAAEASIDELAAAALVGLERRPARPPAVGDGDELLRAALERQPWAEDPATAVLAAAAILTIHDRAGRLPPRLTGVLADPAAAETAAPVSAGAAGLLERLLFDARETELLEEWLGRAARRHELAPALTLPPLLDLARTHPELRSPLIDAGGERLAWLAAQRPEWEWAAALSSEDPAAAWASASVDARLLLLERIRRDDPDRGRSLIEASWDADPGPERARLLAALEPTLTSADEALLERALSDRRREVRDAAAQLLAGLPGSAFQQRLWTRLAPLVRVEGRLRRRLIVDLPADGEPNLAEQLGAELRGRKLGPRAAQLAALVAGSDLTRWSSHLNGITVFAVVQLAAESEQADALLAGLLAANRRQRHADWAAALAVGLADPAPLTVIPADAAEEPALALLKALPGERAPEVLLSLPAWGPRLSDRAVALLLGPDAALGPPMRARTTLHELARRLHPDAFEAARAAIEVSSADPLDLLTILDLRQALIRELPTP